MTGNNISLENGLVARVDWLSYTVQEKYTPDEIIEFMGFDLQLFREMPNGANGYKRMRKYENISVLYDGADNMGIHVNVTGSSIATLLESYNNSLLVDTGFGSKAREVYTWEETVFSRFCLEVLKIGHLTRIDLAIDDYGTNYYSTDDIVKKLANGQIVSKWRTAQNNQESIIGTNEKVGHTVYFGSTKSDIRMRIYDKQLERNKGLSKDSEKYHHEKWTRWELQLRKERADSVANLLSKGLSLGDVVMGVLSNYFRIIELDDSNKSRCSLDSKWECFVNNVRKLKITVRKEDKTLEMEIEQFEHQNGRKVSKIFYAVGGSVDYFWNLAKRYECRLTMQDREQLGIA